MATLQELGTVRLQLRLGGEDYQKALHAVQGDTGRVIEWDILDRDSNVVTALPGVVPVLYVRRPDGSAVGSAQGTITGGVISIPVPSSLLAYAGEAEAQVQLIDSAKQWKLHDEKYRLRIEESLEAGAAPGQNLWFSLADLNAAISTVQTLKQQYNNDVAAVSTMRAEVKTNRDYVASVYTQMSNVITSENARVTAENERKTAEIARASAEIARASAESKRVSQESARKSSEVVRGQAEATRVSQESARVAAETARASAESGRTTAEGGRVTAETARVTQYQQAQNLLDVLGENPNVQLGASLAALQKSAQPATHYAPGTPIGVYVKTDLTIGHMAYIEINVHTYTSSDRLQRYVLQFHALKSANWAGVKLIALDGSKPIVASLYLIDSKVCFWIPSDTPWKTYFITAYRNENPAKNLVTSITNEGKPTVYQSTHEISSIEPRPNATASSDGLMAKENYVKLFNLETRGTSAVGQSVMDTRAENYPPYHYLSYEKGARETHEAKIRTVVGLPAGTGSMVTVTTVVRWPDASGGYPFQLATTDEGKIYTRVGRNASTWSGWLELSTDDHTHPLATLSQDGLMRKEDLGKVYNAKLINEPFRIVTATDLNTLTEPGYYGCYSTATATECQNTPTNNAFAMSVELSTSVGVNQHLTSYAQGSMQQRSYIRSLYNGTWTPWLEVMTNASTVQGDKIVQSANYRMVTDAEKTAWNGKANGNHSHDSVQTTQNAALKFSRLTQGQYNALGTKDPNTLYIIVG